MSLADLLSFFITVVAIAIAPGPVVLVLMVRSASKDLKGAIGFSLGYTIGGVIIISAVCFGLSAWLTAVPEVLEYSKYVMMAYILWMARDIWKGKFSLTTTCGHARRPIFSSIGAGLITCFISPYMMILFPLVLPEMMDVTQIQMPDFLIVSVLTFMGLAVGSGLVVSFAAQISKMAKSERSMTIMNRSLAALLVAAGGFMALA